jgi:excisionase family DNA binding protein
MNTATKLDTLGGYYTIASMAEALGVSPRALDTFIHEHGVKVTKLGGTPLVRLTDLDQYRAKIGHVRRLLEGQHDR